MTGGQEHGVEVETNSILAVLEPTRVLQHALEVLWDNNLPAATATNTTRAAESDSG